MTTTKIAGYSYDALTNTLTMTASFAKKASQLNTPEYKTLLQLRLDNPGMKIEKATPKASSNRPVSIPLFIDTESWCCLMANAEHKLKIVHLMNIFRRETDAQHPISMSEIKKKLAKHLSNHEPDRKAIYDDFDALEAYGFIVHREPNGKRYYLENPDFTYNEVRMIADCVSASKFLSERQARNLIEKLKGLCTVYDSSKLTRQVVVQNRTRTDNDESRDELDKIFQAINERKQISYLYFDYDLRKKRKYRYKDDIKCISPWAVIYDNNFYYLLAYDGKKMRVYRIDHMEGVEVEEAEAEGLEEFKKIKLSDYTKQTFGMYSGELQSVTMRFPNNMVGTVLDRFGREVTLMKADDRHFRITVPIAVSPQFYGWVFGLKNMVTIESPQSVVDGMKEMLAAVEKRYEDSKGSQ